MLNLNFSRILTGGLLSAAAILFLYACQCDESALKANTWVLKEYGAASAPTAVITDPSVQPEILLRFDTDGSLTGTDGCNQILSQYALESGCKMKIDDISGTLMFCQANGIMDQANQIRELLMQVSQYQISGNKLVLETSDGRMLQYRKQIWQPSDIER
jgi:copper homeostasis protein (lipoprotein)/putative lipoprotein